MPASFSVTIPVVEAHVGRFHIRLGTCADDAGGEYPISLAGDRLLIARPGKPFLVIALADLAAACLKAAP